MYIVEDYHASNVLVIDPTLAGPVIKACTLLELVPTHILNTHHHWDHTGGNEELVETYRCQVVANAADAARIPCISQPVTAGKPLLLGSLGIKVLDVSAHTIGHLAFVMDDALFCGDTLFGGGCGRIFEGSHEQMWHSLQMLAALDGRTKVYCAHEYTLANLNFAAAVDPHNQALLQRITRDSQSRDQQLPTIPSTIMLEKETNPFLRPLDAEFCSFYDPALSSLEIFSELRRKKDSW